MTGPDAPPPEPAQSDLPAGAALTSDEGPALRDARAIAVRIADDERQADAARARFESEGLPTIEPDKRMAAIRQPAEKVHAIHANAYLELNGGGKLATGTLYLTSRRLVHAGEGVTEVPLSAIEEMAIALDRLLLIRLQESMDLAIEVAHPRLLRVQIAAAKSAARGKSS